MTCRRHRAGKRLPKVGQTLHFYTGRRQKGKANLFARAVLEKVFEVTLYEDALEFFQIDPWKSGIQYSLSPEGMDRFAKDDGFQCYPDLWEFMKNQYKFEGKSIKMYAYKFKVTEVL